jgi:hypothetical protein
MIACAVTESTPKDEFNVLYDKVSKQLQAYAIAKDSEKWATFLLLNARRRRQIKYRSYCNAYELLTQHPEFTEKHQRYLRDCLADINTSFANKG